MRSIMRMVAVALCCLTFAGLLAGCGDAAAKTPTPTVDPVTRAYLSALRSSYGQYYAAAEPEVYQCHDRVAVDSNAQLLRAMPACLPLETAAHSAAQTALARLATAAPPARWQQADAGLKQALRAILPYYVARANAIATGSAEQFTQAFSTLADQALPLFCDPIATFNAGPPQISPPLQEPYGICDGHTVGF